MGKKKLLALVASYRNLGNSEIAAKAAARELGDDWDFSLIRLPKLKIDPCKGCYACLLPGKSCNIDDDLAWLLEKMNQADALIFAAPNYLLGPVGIIKMLADRALQAAPYLESFQKKRTVVLLTMGRREFLGYADSVLASQAAALGFKISGLEIFLGTHPGEISLEEDFTAKARRLAECISSPEPIPEDRPGRCPRCRSDLFRLGPHGLECAMCKASAVLEDGTLHFTHFHHQFSDEGLKEHYEWLVKKKLEFAQIKNRLKDVRDNFTGGDWLTPPEK